MRLFYGKHVVVANKVQKPGLKNVNGKQWEKYPITLNGKKSTAHRDVNHGEYFFFQRGNDWYACRIIQEGLNSGTEVMLDPAKNLKLDVIERYKRATEAA